MNRRKQLTLIQNQHWLETSYAPEFFRALNVTDTGALMIDKVRHSVEFTDNAG